MAIFAQDIQDSVVNLPCGDGLILGLHINNSSVKSHGYGSQMSAMAAPKWTV